MYLLKLKRILEPLSTTLRILCLIFNI